jgi:protein dpy-30
LQQVILQNQQRQAELLQHPPHPGAVPSSGGPPAALPQPPHQQPPPNVPPAAAVPSSSSAQQSQNDALKRLPIRAYLDQTVVPILLNGKLDGVGADSSSPLGSDSVWWLVLCCAAAFEIRSQDTLLYPFSFFLFFSSSGMSELVQKRPANPIEFLAAYLLAHDPQRMAAGAPAGQPHLPPAGAGGPPQHPQQQHHHPAPPPTSSAGVGTG